MDNQGTIDRETLVNLAIYDLQAALDRGEATDIETWSAGDPEIAAELRAYLDDLDGMGLAPPPWSGGDPERTVLLPRRATGKTPTSPELRPGDALGDYVLLEEIGRGGQGVVWKARPRNAREIVVALKTFRGPEFSDPAVVRELRAEARAVARMKHENIVRVSYFGEDSGRWFLVMEFMDGGTLDDRIGRSGMDPRQAAALLEKVARAVHHAHTRNPGVVHLDLKPGNVLLTAEGEPRVADFGLSTHIESEGPEDPGAGSDDEIIVTLSRAGIVGTLPYMSPEMARGSWSDVSTASDIYGLGAILYETLIGRPPFLGKDNKATRELVVRGRLAGPRALNRRVDRELDAVCRKCLAYAPGQRYGSADALANDLRRWLERRPTLAAGRPSVLREARSWVRRNPVAVALTVVAMLGLWGAALAASMAELRADNAKDCANLASQLDRELRLVRRATRVLASDPRLVSALEGPDEDSRRRALEAYLKAAIEKENLFGITGDPFINIFVLSPDGVLLADTLPGSTAVGKGYAVRDYYRAFFGPGPPPGRDDVYVARTFQSSKDGRYKIAVSTRIWGEGEDGGLLGILVANFTIGPRLIDFELGPDTEGASVLCPMDRSDPDRDADDGGPPWPDIAVLDRSYKGTADDRPIAVQLPPSLDFQGDPGLVRAATGPSGGRIVDYHRVGDTQLVVELRRPCPWPFAWPPWGQ
jgi:serine/threonine-protein kinase